MNKQAEHLPDWLNQEENYIPHKDQDAFVDKSILSVLHVTAKIKMQDQRKPTVFSMNASVKMLCTLVFLILISLTKSFSFVMVMNVYLLAVISMLDTERLIRILRMTAGITVFTLILMLPAFYFGSFYAFVMIPSKVFASVTAMGILSHTTRWNAMTGALKRFFVPDLFILIVELTIKYIYMLGELSFQMLHALKSRSVGKNNRKYTSVASVAGTIFLRSREMAEEMQQAMECRGFSGAYRVYQREKPDWKDGVYLLIHIGFIFLYLYFGRMLK